MFHREGYPLLHLLWSIWSAVSIWVHLICYDPSCLLQGGVPHVICETCFGPLDQQQVEGVRSIRYDLFHLLRGGSTTWFVLTWCKGAFAPSSHVGDNFTIICIIDVVQYGNWMCWGQFILSFRGSSMMNHRESLQNDSLNQTCKVVFLKKPVLSLPINKSGAPFTKDDFPILDSPNDKGMGHPSYIFSATL